MHTKAQDGAPVVRLLVFLISSDGACFVNTFQAEEHVTEPHLELQLDSNPSAGQPTRAHTTLSVLLACHVADHPKYVSAVPKSRFGRHALAAPAWKPIAYHVFSEHHTDCVWLTKAYEINVSQLKLRVSRAVHICWKA